jgi:hypothetical protein
MVDWRTLKAAPSIHIPIERDIPRGVLKFPGRGLSIRKKPEEYETSDSDPDSNSDGSQPLRLSNNPTVVASRRLWMRKRGRNDEQLPLLHPPHLDVVPHIPGASNTAGTSNTAGAINRAGASSSDAAGASGTAGAGGMLLALALQALGSEKYGGCGQQSGCQWIGGHEPAISHSVSKEST